VSTCKEKEFEESKELQEFRMREQTLHLPRRNSD